MCRTASSSARCSCRPTARAGRLPRQHRDAGVAACQPLQTLQGVSPRGNTGLPRGPDAVEPDRKVPQAARGTALSWLAPGQGAGRGFPSQLHGPRHPQVRSHTCSSTGGRARRHPRDRPSMARAGTMQTYERAVCTITPGRGRTGEASVRRPLHELGEGANHTDYMTAVHPVRRDAWHMRFEITSRRSGR